MNDVIERLADDFENERGPFDSVEFPEARLVDELGEEQSAEYLSMLCTLDYNRGVDQLVENIEQVADERATVLTPSMCAQMPLGQLQSYFAEVGFRYPNRDAKGWQDNCKLVSAPEFGGSWENVIKASNYDAPELVQLLRDHGFKYIKGDKLAPFYARVVNDHIVSLDRLWELDIPVDTHVRRLSRELFDRPEMSDDEIRARWREIGRSCDISPAVVDGALWQIGYSWDDWGEDYWEEL